MQQKNSGFTLLEVLVASTLLFACISVVTLIFKSAYVASQKAQIKVEQTGVIPALLPLIQQSIRQQTTRFGDQLSGNGIIWGMNYQWQAHVIAFKSPADKFDVDTTRMESYPKRYKKWLVSLELDGVDTAINNQTADIVNTRKNGLIYQYHELSWVTQ